MDPLDSNTLYAAAYEVRRDGFAGGDPEKGWGPGSGIYKTTDGGRTWRRLTAGLPSGPLGRIGLDVAASHPQRGLRDRPDADDRAARERRRSRPAAGARRVRRR